MGKGFLKIIFSEEDSVQSNIITEMGLFALLDNLYNDLREDETVVIMIKRDCALICKRRLGEEENILKKFTNFGFGSRAESLSSAIRNIADNLPNYCYKAIQGDKKALRKTTEHLAKIYDRKLKILATTDKTRGRIENISRTLERINTYLELDDEHLANVIDTLVIEIPKNRELYEQETEEDIIIVE